MLKRFVFISLCVSLLLTACSGHKSVVSDSRDGIERSEGNGISNAWTGDISINARLSAEVNETSGLAHHQGMIWTVNDSGDGPFVYGLRNNQLVRKVRIKGAVNIDWEDLAQDDEYLYIADCGNNFAKRKLIQIYKVRWTDLISSDTVDVSATLNIAYLNQPDVSNPKLHNYDCEAITVVDDKLWLFSKNRLDEESWLYILDKHQLQQEVDVAERFDVRGLVTAVDYDSVSRRIALLGYTKQRIFGQSFLWIAPVQGTPQWREAKRLTLHPYAQWEALVWDKEDQNGRLILSTERNPLLDVSIGELQLPGIE